MPPTTTPAAAAPSWSRPSPAHPLAVRQHETRWLPSSVHEPSPDPRRATDAGPSGRIVVAHARLVRRVNTGLTSGGRARRATGRTRRRSGSRSACFSSSGAQQASMPGEADGFHVLQRVAVGAGDGDVLVGDVEAHHAGIVGVQGDQDAGLALAGERVLGHRRDDVGDHDVRRRADVERDLALDDLGGQRGVVEEAEAVVDALAPELVDGDGDVVGRPVLAGVDRAAQPVARRLGERGGEGGVVDVALDRVGAHPDEQVAVGHRAGERRHLHGVGGPGRLVEVEDHAAVDVEVVAGVEDAGLDALPHRLDGDAEADDEARARRTSPGSAPRRRRRPRALRT